MDHLTRADFHRDMGIVGRVVREFSRTTRDSKVRRSFVLIEQGRHMSGHVAAPLRAVRPAEGVAEIRLLRRYFDLVTTFRGFCQIFEPISTLTARARIGQNTPFNQWHQRTVIGMESALKEGCVAWNRGDVKGMQEALSPVQSALSRARRVADHVVDSRVHAARWLGVSFRSDSALGRAFIERLVATNRRCPLWTGGAAGVFIGFLILTKGFAFRSEGK